MEDGTCQECEPYTKVMPNTDGKVCGSDKCMSRQKLLFDGTCELCYPYEKAIGPDGKECGS